MSTPHRRPSRPPRYSNRPLPRYRHLPGRTPHPERDPAGHSFGLREAVPEGWTAEGWRQNELYLYGVDLFNLGYWWEAHAAWEALWQTSGRSEPAGRFLQGLIQMAAALVQHRAGQPQGARRLAGKGLDKLRKLARELEEASGLPVLYMGVDVDGFATASERFFESEPQGMVAPPFLVLD